MRERGAALRRCQAAGDVQRPQRAELGDITTRVVTGLRAQVSERGASERPASGALLEQATCGADIPFALVRVQRGELPVGHCSEIHFDRPVGGGPSHAIETAVGAVPEFVARVVTMLRVDPINHVGGAIGTVLDVDGHVGGVGREEQIVASVKRFVSGARADIDLMVELVAVKIVSEEMIAIEVGPVIAEVDHGADMRMAAVDRRGAGLAGAAFAAVVARGSQQIVF